MRHAENYWEKAVAVQQRIAELDIGIEKERNEGGFTVGELVKNFIISPEVQTIMIMDCVGGKAICRSSIIARNKKYDSKKVLAHCVNNGSLCVYI